MLETGVWRVRIFLRFHQLFGQAVAGAAKRVAEEDVGTRGFRGAVEGRMADAPGAGEELQAGGVHGEEVGGLGRGRRSGSTVDGRIGAGGGGAKRFS
jgi:hypothetical protein